MTQNDAVKLRARSFRRIAITMIAGLALIGTVLFAFRFWFYHPVGSGPAGPSVPSERFAAPWTQREVVLLGIGDSITAGFGASPEKSFMGRLVNNPPDEYPDMRGVCLKAVFPHLRVYNVAVSGSNSIDHAQKQIPAVKPFPPEVFGLVVMTTGGNDLIHWYGARPPVEGAMFGAALEEAQPWITNYEQRLEAMLKSVESLFPGGCSIFLGNIYDPTDGVGSAWLLGLPPWRDGLAILEKYNNVIARCASRFEAVHVVNLHRGFLGHGITCSRFWGKHYRGEDPHYWYYENIEDPNERGHDAIRRLFLLKFLEVADKKPWDRR